NGAAMVRDWNTRMDRDPNGARLRTRLSGTLPDDWEAAIPDLADQSVASRQSSQKVLGALAEVIPELVGGSADLTPSNGTAITVGGVFNAVESGRRFHWGVREHGMMAAINGLAAHGGFRPYGATFLVFLDYCK